MGSQTRTAASITATLGRGGGLVALGCALALAAGIGFAPTAQAIGAAPPKVAIIVGPVGESLTPAFVALAEAAAVAAERHGATVARAYSPGATPERVLAAVEGAQIVAYFGHGTGFPNPYSGQLNPATVNGWALQGPAANGTHADSWRDGTLTYYGEAWLAANARPAPGFVMIYSNVCYAPGAGEMWMASASAEEAAARVAAYSRTPLSMGAAAYFATDYDLGAARLIDMILAEPNRSFGEIFAVEPKVAGGTVTRIEHPAAEGEIWLHRTQYAGRADYWYAYAGDPKLTPAGTTLVGVAGSGARPAAPASTFAVSTASAPVWPVPGYDPSLGRVPADPPVPEFDAGIVGTASWFEVFPPGHSGAAVALPWDLDVPIAKDKLALVCGDKGCVELPIIDKCICYWGSTDQRVANLSIQAWAMVTEEPLSEGLTGVTIYPEGEPKITYNIRDPVRSALIPEPTPNPDVLVRSEVSGRSAAASRTP